MTVPRTCLRCGARPVATARDAFCHQCMPGGPFTPPPCRKCGSTERYYSGGLCQRCHRFAPQVIDSCVDCLGWGVTRHTSWICEGCRGWRRRFKTIGRCVSCQDSKALSPDGFCRLCWRNAVGARPHGIGPSILEMNRYGQQLSFAGLIWGQRRPKPPLAQPVTVRRRYPVGHEQLALMDVPRDLSRLGVLLDPPDPDFARLLDQVAHEHARKHGWSKTKRITTCQGLRILACIQGTPGALVKASEVELLDPVAFNRQPILDVLETAGLLQDDRVPSILTWFATRVVGLPEPITAELQVWFDILLHGSSTAPRSRPRAPGTIKIRVHSVLPAVREWAAAGRSSLREITREDIDRVLPVRGTARALMGTSLRSLFRTLKAKRLVFTNPTTHRKTGSPERRLPLPISESAMRVALDSDSPARTALATLIGYHALRSKQVRSLLLTDVRDGRIHLPGRTILLAPPVRDTLTVWLDYRSTRWPETINPHLFINKQSAVRITQVSNVWVVENLGMSPQALREDRILYEAETTKDLRRLCDLFGLSVDGAERYLRTTAPR